MGGEAGATLGIGFEQVAKLLRANRFGMLLESYPSWSLSERRGLFNHFVCLIHVVPSSKAPLGKPAGVLIH